jgi:hypothetical protein
MSKPRKLKKPEGKPEPPLMISLRITLPRKAVWTASGFLTGSLTTEAIVRAISSLHGGG